LGWLVISATGFLLLATKSRGGIIAALAGLAEVWWARININRVQRKGGGDPFSKRSKGGILMLLSIVLILFGYGVANKSLARFSAGDSSRADLWPAGLSMLWDAPGGWGSGQAANVYAQWYQSSDDPRGYLSLVNYHLTWLVENNLAARIAYSLAWSSLFWFLWPTADSRTPKDAIGDSFVASRIMPIGAGCWIALFVAAIFSTVLKWMPLWIIPVCWLVVVLWQRIRGKNWPSWRLWCLFSLVGLITLGCLHLTGWALRRSSSLAVAGAKGVVLGKGPHSVVLYRPEIAVLGDRWGQEVRRLVDESESMVIVLNKMDISINTPKSAAWIFTGTLPESVPSAGELFFLNVVCSPELIDWIKKYESIPIRVYISDSLSGPARFDAWEEFAESDSRVKVSVVRGANIFIPNWTELILQSSGDIDGGD
jgi:hypothetical protein